MSIITGTQTGLADFGGIPSIGGNPAAPFTGLSITDGTHSVNVGWGFLGEEPRVTWEGGIYLVTMAPVTKASFFSLGRSWTAPSCNLADPGLISGISDIGDASLLGFFDDSSAWTLPIGGYIVCRSSAPVSGSLPSTTPGYYGVIRVDNIRVGAAASVTIYDPLSLYPNAPQNAQGGTLSTVTLPLGASSLDGFYTNGWVYIASGTDVGQRRHVTAYVGATQIATVSPNWGTAPDNTSVLSVYAPPKVLEIVNPNALDITWWFQTDGTGHFS